MAKKAPNTIVRCIDCKFATLMQWKKNPIIAACSKKNGDRDVARTQRVCEYYRENTNQEINITKM